MWELHKNCSAGADRSRGKEAWGDRRLLRQGLLCAAEKLSKHSNLRKSFFLPAQRAPWRWRRGGRVRRSCWSWKEGSIGSFLVHHGHSLGLKCP